MCHTVDAGASGARAFGALTFVLVADGCIPRIDDAPFVVLSRVVAHQHLAKNPRHTISPFKNGRMLRKLATKLKRRTAKTKDATFTTMDMIHDELCGQIGFY